MVTTDELNERAASGLPGWFGVRFTSIEDGRLTSELAIRPEHLASLNGYLHAATVIALADTSCGFGAWSHLPEGARSFTTIEMKSNHLGTAREGTIACEARLAHRGRTTQVWDAAVTDAATRKTIALFRCTQMILYPA